MDAQSWGSFLVVLGLIQVVLAGIFLRRDKALKKSPPGSTGGGAGRESAFWIWIGRLGAVLCMAGMLMVVMKS